VALSQINLCIVMNHTAYTNWYDDRKNQARSLSDIDRPPLAENLQMGYQLFYPTHAMEAP